MEGPTCLIGCAGWSLARAVAGFFPAGGSHLERYAQVLPAVELNSSFYRPHRPATYARWRDSVPATFRFSVKVPKVITHERRLCDVEEPLARFLEEVGHLDEKLGCLLVQLPPSLRFEPAVAGAFFEVLRARTRGMWCASHATRPGPRRRPSGCSRTRAWGWCAPIPR
ncbi:DUF72 domain-containing protein [Cystobacter fuscus]